MGTYDSNPMLNNISYDVEFPDNTTQHFNANIIAQMEKEWPEMTKEFKKIQQQQYELFLHKQHDYGPGNISVGTQLQTPEEISQP